MYVLKVHAAYRCTWIIFTCYLYDRSDTSISKCYNWNQIRCTYFLHWIDTQVVNHQFSWNFMKWVCKLQLVILFSIKSTLITLGMYVNTCNDMHSFFFSFFSEKFWNFLQTIRWIFWALVSIAFGFFLLTAGLNISLQSLFPQNVCRSGTLHVVSQLWSGFKYFPVHFWGVYQLSSMFSLWQQKTSWFGAEV